MLQEMVLPIDFGQGVDTKSDPKLVIRGKLLNLQNAVFTKAGQIRKRGGYAAITNTIINGTTITNPRMLKSFNEETITADQTKGKLYSYSPTATGWYDKGKYVPVQVTDVNISNYEVNETFQHSAVLSNYGIFVWNDHISGTSPSDQGISKASVIDIQNNEILLAESNIGPQVAGGSMPKASTLGNFLAVFYSDNALDPRNQIAMKILNTPTMSFTGPFLVSPGGNYSTVQAPLYDVADVTGFSKVAIAYASGGAGSATDITVKTVNPSGTITGTHTESGIGEITAINVHVDPSNQNIWVFYSAAAVPTIGYFVLDFSLGLILAHTQITADFCSHFAVIDVSATTKQLYFDENNVRTVQVTSTGSVGSIATILQGVNIAGQMLSYNGANYLPVSFIKTDQSGLFIVDVADSNVIAKAFSGEIQTTPHAWECKWMQLSSTQFGLVAGVKSVGAGLAGTSYTALEFNAPDSYQAVQANDVLLLNGGIVNMYDGENVVELGFHLFPDDINLSFSTSGGALTDGAYSVQVTYRWTDVFGNVYESAPSPAQSITLTGGSGISKITVTGDYLYLTAKQTPRANAQIYIYCTDTNGTVHYQIDQTNGPGLINNPLGSTFTGTVGEVFTSHAILYTDSGEVENIAPPPCMQMIVAENRVFLTNSEIPNQLWYSKTITPGTGVSTSDVFTMNIDPTKGDITGLGFMDEKLVMFKKTGIIFFIGNGPNDLGANNNFSLPQFVPSDVGCQASKSIVLMPNGIMFQSTKGIYLLDRSLNTTYIGAPVEIFNSAVITSANIRQDRNQVRFLSSTSNSTLVYDYFFNQWSSFTNHSGYGASNINGVYTYARTDGSIYQETESTYVDNTTPFNVLAQTAWIKLSSVQNFQRVRRYIMLGDYTTTGGSTHSLVVTIAYDFSSSTFETQTESLPILGSGVVQFRARVARQKCDAIQLTFTENSNNTDGGDFLDLSNLSLEVGVKKGVNKLPASQTIG